MLPKTSIRLSLVAALMLLHGSAGAQTQQSPEARARQAVEWALAGQFEKLLAASDESMRKAASIETWRTQAGPLMAGYGKLISFGKAVTSISAPNTIVVLPANLEHASIDFTVALRPDARIAGFYFKPSAKQSQANVKSAEARARVAVDWVLAGEYQKLFDASTPQMKQAMPVETWKSKVVPLQAGMGKLIEFGTPSSESTAAGIGVSLPAKFERGDFVFNVIVDPSGAIASLYVRPADAKAAYSHPSYARPDSYIERAVTVGAGEWKLPATLSLPKTAGKVPAIVLVHGSGAHDRDETVFASKPFRDLAEGLASDGIAVLRYEKRNQAHQARVIALPRFTPQEETVEDAVRAVALVKTMPEVDPKRIFVLGHSLGGYLLPLILEQAPYVAGGISLAGTTRPLEDIIVEQYEYIISLQTANAPEGAQKAGEKVLADARAAAAQVKALKPGDEDGPPIQNIPRSYWLALKGYDPAARAAKIRTRFLILQGERDYQVTMTDFGNWRLALGSRDDASFISYPSLNHLFEEGSGKSTPAEYAKPGHMAGQVIDDISQWIHTR